MIVENIILRNVIINQGADDVDNHISRDDFFDYHPLKNVIFILLYQALPLHFLPFFPLTMKFEGQHKVSKGAKIRSRYNQVPHPTQIPIGKLQSQLDTTNESQEVSPFPAGDHKLQINRRAQRHSKYKSTA